MEVAGELASSLFWHPVVKVKRLLVGNRVWILKCTMYILRDHLSEREVPGSLFNHLHDILRGERKRWEPTGSGTATHSFSTALCALGC